MPISLLVHVEIRRPPPLLLWRSSTFRTRGKCITLRTAPSQQSSPRTPSTNTPVSPSRMTLTRLRRTYKATCTVSSEPPAQLRGLPSCPSVDQLVQERAERERHQGHAIVGAAATCWRRLNPAVRVRGGLRPRVPSRPPVEKGANAAHCPYLCWCIDSPLRSGARARRSACLR